MWGLDGAPSGKAVRHLAMVLACAALPATAQDAPLLFQSDSGQVAVFPSEVAEVRLFDDAEIGPSVRLRLHDRAARDLAALTRGMAGQTLTVRFAVRC